MRVIDLEKVREEMGDRFGLFTIPGHLFKEVGE